MQILVNYFYIKNGNTLAINMIGTDLIILIPSYNNQSIHLRI